MSNDTYMVALVSLKKGTLFRVNQPEYSLTGAYIGHGTHLALIPTDSPVPIARWAEKDKALALEALRLLQETK